MTAPGGWTADRSGRPVRVLVTGAGGPAAIAAMKSLRAEPAVEILAADMDPWAAGLYLVPPAARTLIPAGAAPDFTDVVLTRCRALGVDVLLPTVDAELRPLARARAAFTAAGISLLLAPAGALDVIWTSSPWPGAVPRSSAFPAPSRSIAPPTQPAGRTRSSSSREPAADPAA